jgi:hypothetical protein
MSLQKIKITAGILVLLISGLVYLLTLSPSIYFIDSGELAVVCNTLGIAHPTGYPLYTLLGKTFTLIPLKTIIFRLNFLSSILICFTNLFVFLILLDLSRFVSILKTKELKIWGAFLGALVFAFNPTLWSQATTNEVYALNIFLQTLVVYLSLFWYLKAQDNRDKRRDKVLFLFVFLYGLSFGDHMSTLLLFPALAFLILIAEGKQIFNAKRLLSLALFFVLGLTIYLYLPIRAAQKPLLNWGDPTNFTNFIRHVSAWQYRIWMFSESAGELWGNFKNFLNLFFNGFQIHLLIVGLLGIYNLIKCNIKILIFLIIVLWANILYGINYSIADIDPYFLPSFMVFAVIIGWGMFWIFNICESLLFKGGAKENKRILLKILCFLPFIILPLVTLKLNYFEQDKSRNYLAYEWGKNILRSVEKDAVILTNVWDHYSPWLYLRYIENLRPDVRFVESRLTIRSWHFDYIKKAYPEIFSRSQKEIESFGEQVLIFEQGMLKDTTEIETRYVNMTKSILLKNYDDAPLYTDIVPTPQVRNIQKMIKDNFFEIPEGMVHRLKRDAKYYPYDFPQLNLRGVNDKSVSKDKRTETKLRYYSLMLRRRLSYLSYFKQDSLAQNLARRYQDILY